MRYPQYALALLFVSLLASGNASAAELFNGGSPDGATGARVSDFGRLAVAADDFSTTTAWRLTGVEFWTSEFPGLFEWDGTVRYFIFASSGGLPTGDPLHSGSGVSIVKTAASTILVKDGYRYTFNLAVPIELAAGTTYWLALNVGGGNTIETTQAFWASTTAQIGSPSAGAGSSLVGPPSFSGWRDYGFGLAFRLYGDILGPETGTLTLKTDTVAGCKSVLGTITLYDPAPPEGVRVTLADSLPSVSTPAGVTIAADTTSKNFTIRTTPVAARESGTVSATLAGATLSQPLTVRPMGLSSVSVTPSTMVGSNQTSGKATLECNAGPGAILVDLASSNAAAATPVAATVSIPQGVKTGLFDVTTSAVLARTTASISATANGITKSKKITITPAAAVVPTRLSFGDVTVGQTSAPQIATFTNQGPMAFVVNSIAITGTSAAWFSQANTCPAHLAAGASCTISLTFTPAAVASKSAKLSIATSATSTPLSVSLSGSGVLP